MNSDGVLRSALSYEGRTGQWMALVGTQVDLRPVEKPDSG